MSLTKPIRRTAASNSSDVVVENVEPKAQPGGPPSWLVALAIGLAGAVLSLGLVGLVLADAAAYSAPLAFGLGGLLFVGLLMLLKPALGTPRTTRSAHIVAVIAVVFIGAGALWNSANVSEHVLINRDAGAYVNAGRWIARDGSLEVRAKARAFKGPNALQFPDVGMLSKRRRPLRQQFHAAHLVPALLAEAHAIGGDRGMLQIPPILGGIALLEFLILAWRLFRNPIFALVATIAFGLMLPQVWFSRDAYSEIVAQILLFAALFLLIDRRMMPPWRAALGAGLFLGAIQATHVDAALLFLGIPILFAVAFLRASTDEERRAVRASNLVLVAGLAVGCVVGFTDLVYRSNRYWNSKWNNERTLLILMAVSALGSYLLVKLWPRLSKLGARVSLNVISWIGFAVVIVAALGAWFVRPATMPWHRVSLVSLQLDGQLVNRFITAKYEMSMWWMSWYLGPITVLAAIVGGACLARELLRGRRFYAIAPTLILLPGTVAYLWHAHAYADHPWVLRRYLTGAFPLFMLLAVGLAQCLWQGRTRLARVGAAVIVAAAVAFPLYTIIPVRSMREQGGYLAAVHDVCRTIGPRAYVVVAASLTQMASPDVREEWMPQTLRSFCGATVGTLYVGTRRSDLQAIQRVIAKQKRPLFLVASGPSTISALAPTAHFIPGPTATNRRFLTQTFSHAPASYETQTLPIAVAKLQTDDVG
jgi:hypothetical protein